MSEQTRAVAKTGSKAAVNTSSQESVLQRAAVKVNQSLRSEINPYTEGHFEHDFSRVQVHHHVPTTLQAKLTIGQPGDQYEREADNVANTVMRMPDPGRSEVQSIGSAPVNELRREPDDEEEKRKNSALGSHDSNATADQPGPDTSPSVRDNALVNELDKKPGAKPNNYDEAAGKTGEAFLKTEAGKQVAKWASETFLDKPGGKVITGAVAAEAFAALYGTHSSLPFQPSIPLDFVKPGLSVKITYEGPVNKPTKVGFTVSFEPKKKEETLSEKNDKYRTETERLRQGLEKDQERDKTPQQRKEDAEFQRRWLLRRDLLTKGSQQTPGGSAGTPPGPAGMSKPGSMQLQMPEYQYQLQDKRYNPPKLHLKDEEDTTLQRKESSAASPVAHTQSVPPIVQNVLHSSGQSLDTSARSFMEARFGHDFSGVRVHADERAAESAHSVNALAYTVGRDVVFGTGQYAPGTMEGKRLLAHELTHVVQQRLTQTSRQIQKYEAGEHAQFGGEQDKQKTVVIHGITITYGELIAMGDFFDNPSLIFQADSAELETLVKLIRRDVATPGSVTTEDWQKATHGRYLKLAEKNIKHFSPSNPKLVPVNSSPGSDNKTTWETYHKEAIALAQTGEKDKALTINAFGDHFLTDAFSAGHLINKLDVMAHFSDQLRHMSGGSKTFFDQVAKNVWANATVASYVSQFETTDTWHNLFHPNINSADRFSLLLQGIYDKEPSLLENAIAKTTHDALNTKKGGIDVENKKGDKWTLPGDTTLASDKRTLEIGRKAVAQSQQDVLSFLNAPASVDYNRLFQNIWDYVPFPTNKGASDIQGVISEKTDPNQKTTMTGIVKLIVDNIHTTIDELVKRGILKKA